MELKDLIVTPLLLGIVFIMAYIIRPYVTDSINRRYFFSGLIARILGAISLGLIYQFYYNGGGDTFMYHTYGSRIVWHAFLESPMLGIKLLFADGVQYKDIYQYASDIYYFRDPNSYAVIRLASIFDLFTFSTYSATAILFAVISFIGAWQFYLTFYEQYPHLHRPLAIVAFFIPSVFFWGSGILKDSITLACLGISTYQIYKIFIKKEYGLGNIVLLLSSLFVIYAIKKFILQAYLPAVIVWIGAVNTKAIRSSVLRILLVPFLVGSAVLLSYYAMYKVGEGDDRYSLAKISETARVTAYDIRYWTGREAGSGYDIGALDGTFESLVRLIPQAINVSLFRPYIWEVRNPLMLLSSIESLSLTLLVVVVLFRKGKKLFIALTQPNILFTLLFGLVFSFAVGVSTFNFGSLARYKIPVLPFICTSFILMLDYSNRVRKLEEFEAKE
ncbi:MAG: hypothetical protein K2U26_01005 [Cyclobacteriaceae bacterium]|nr:hypothetical protein [Cyclobacteriaceae bacterium]